MDFMLLCLLPIISMSAISEAIDIPEDGVLLASDFSERSGIELREINGRPAAVMSENGRLEARINLPKGFHAFTITAYGTNDGNNSLYVDVGDDPRRVIHLQLKPRELGIALVRMENDGIVPIVIESREADGTIVEGVRIVNADKISGRMPFQIKPDLVKQHPRMYFTQPEIEKIRERAAHPRSKIVVDEFLSLMSRRANDAPPKNPPLTEDPFRGFGSKIRNLAFAYILTEDEKYLSSARDWMKAVCNYPSWAGDRDLGAGHILFGLALGYDWLYRKLNQEERSAIEKALLDHARIMYAESIEHTGRYWSSAWWQNHCWINHCGLAAAGIALYDIARDEAQEWNELVRYKFHMTLEHFGPDGSNYEGVAYSEYGTIWLLHYLEMLKSITGEALYNNPYLKNHINYRIYTHLPDWKHVTNYGDCPRITWRVPSYVFYRLGSEYADGRAYWLAETLKRERKWRDNDLFCVLWYDPTIEPVPPDEMPLWSHFPDLDIATFRTSWDVDASMLFFKCGPPSGHHAVNVCPTLEEGYFAIGHANPDANSFTFWAKNRWFISDPAAYTHNKLTSLENTVLVDEQGQRGEREWFDGYTYLNAPSQPHIEHVISTPDADYVVGEAAPAYPEDVGLRSFKRRVLFVKEESPFVVVADQLVMDSPKSLRWCYHADVPFSTDEKQFSLDNDGVKLYGYILSGDNFQLETRPTVVMDHKDHRRPGGMQEKGQQMDIVMEPVKETWMLTLLTLEPSELIFSASEMSLTLGEHKIRFHPDSGIELDGKPIETE